MKYVVDSSVAFKWVVTETDTPAAVRLRDDFRNGVHELLAPDFFPYELAHALTRAERQLRIPVTGALIRLVDILSTAPRLVPSLPLVLRACEISSQTRVGVYDCTYVALAEQEGCELVTADDRLVRVLQPAFPFLTLLSTLP